MPTSTDSRRPEDGYLTVRGLTAGYGAAPVISDISLTVAQGEVVTVIGPNGGGKSTLLKCLTGRLKPQAGQVLFGGQDVTAASGSALTKGGLGYVPQHNDIFPTLTVRENLEMGGYLLPKAQVGERIGQVLETFPTLRPLLKRSGKLLSGGERKLLGIARCLISSPKLVILDEPTAGLSPILARSILDDQVTSLAQAGVTILLVEQRAHQAMQIADWCYVLVSGRVELDDAPATLLARPDFGELFLGRSARTQPQAAAPGQPQAAAPDQPPAPPDQPQAVAGPAAGAQQASRDDG
jgi:ABC-type branched-subunit amino acid transport system ATPase component